MNITISNQFQDLIYPLTQEELTVLEQSILTHGVRDPLVVWEENGKNYLLDGHHRKKLIDKHKITKYTVTKLKFNNKYEVISWIIDNQLGRRNATPEGISYLRGLRYKNEKLSPHRPNKGEKISPLKTSERLAQQYKITSRTIYNDEKFADAIETISKVFPTPKKQKDIKNKILTRQINLSKSDLVELSELSASYIKEVISGEKELWRVKLEIEQKRKKKNKKPVKIILPEEIKMYQGDCVQVMKKMKENTVDAGLLDPPYGIGFLNKEWDNFTPSLIEKYNLIEQAYFVGGKSPALEAGLYDLSYEGGKKYQKWCSEWGKELLRIVKPGGHILCFCSPRMYHRLCCGMEDIGWEVRNTLTWNFGTGFPMSMSISQQIDKINGEKSRFVCANPNRKNRLNWDKNDKSIVAPITSDAKEWEGWHTHLKPSLEPILLARKPLSEKTVAENVLKWGTGALNIGACRIPIPANDTQHYEGNNEEELKDVKYPLQLEGRFPSNVILSEKAGEIMSQQAGQDISQYFYCAKPSQSERDFGCDGLDIKERYPRTQKAKGYMAQKGLQPSRNPHPTIKPVKLCQYLTTLITPYGGTIIDCFAGSGTTGMACAQNNFKFIGIEKEPEYYQIARRRIMAAYKKQMRK